MALHRQASRYLISYPRSQKYNLRAQNIHAQDNQKNHEKKSFMHFIETAFNYKVQLSLCFYFQAHTIFQFNCFPFTFFAFN